MARKENTDGHIFMTSISHGLDIETRKKFRKYCKTQDRSMTQQLRHYIRKCASLIEGEVTDG